MLNFEKKILENFKIWKARIKCAKFSSSNDDNNFNLN